MPGPPPPATDPAALADRLRGICLALPGALDRDPDWEEIAGIVAAAHRAVAPEAAPE